MDGAQSRPLGLQTTEAYVVVRQLPESQGGKWVAFLGLGKAQIPVVNPAAKPRMRGGRAANNERRETRGRRSFDTRGDAVDYAISAWLRHVRALGASAREALLAPHLVIIEQDDHRSGWDVVTQGKPVVGLKPTGEVELHHG